MKCTWRGDYSVPLCIDNEPMGLEAAVRAGIVIFLSCQKAY